jgi:hypothetical protein
LAGLRVERPLTTKPDVSIASRVAPKIQLAAVHFARVSSAITDAGPPEGELGWNLETIGVVWDADAASMRVIVPYVLSITKTAPGGATPSAIVKIEVFMRLDYSFEASETLEHAELGHAACVLGVMHSWPYFRSEVQALTAKMELPALTLPSIVSGHIEGMATVRELTDAEKTAVAAPAPDPALAEQRAG